MLKISLIALGLLAFTSTGHAQDCKYLEDGTRGKAACQRDSYYNSYRERQQKVDDGAGALEGRVVQIDSVARVA